MRTKDAALNNPTAISKMMGKTAAYIHYLEAIRRKEDTQSRSSLLVPYTLNLATSRKWETRSNF